MPSHLHHGTQPIAPSPQGDARALDQGDGVLHVGDPLPALLGVVDMCRAFGYSRSYFYKLEKRREFARFEIDRPIGSRKWSGLLVQRHLDGQKSARQFGAKSYPRVVSRSR